VSTLLAMPGAKGLFHRAIIESGSMRSVRTKEVAAEAANKLLSALGLTRSQAGELRNLPAQKLVAASATAGGAGPVVDGRSVPHQTWMPGAPPEAAGVALIVGNCKDEATYFTKNQELFSLDEAGLRSNVVKNGIPDEKVGAILAAYHKDFPKDSPSDLYFRITADRGARRNAILQAEAKVAQKSGTVYMYNFAWDTPIVGGKLRAFHTAELPLAMRLVLSPEADGLSKQIAGAWAGFARTGDPNHKGLPHWAAYSTEKRATMVFDAGKTASVDNPVGTEMALLHDYPGGLL
jgi:para-nitrobenzyl esterase